MLGYVCCFSESDSSDSVHYIDYYFVCPYAEPSPEERLQKLHTDIKFALKVDNPVSDSFYSFFIFMSA